MDTYLRWPVRFVEGKGAILIDDEGRTYIDMLAGIAVASVGHAHPAVAEAIALQARRLIHVSNLYLTQPQEDLGARLAGLTGGMQAFFCNSGAEAVEAALKLARRWGQEHKDGAHRVVAMHGGFHGRTLGALTVTGQQAKRDPFEPLVPGVRHVAFGDVAALEAALDDGVAAVILEPVQGEAGVIVPPPGYLREVRALCTARRVLLIADEVQTGIGRTGSWFACEHEDVTPDVLCLAKGLGGGLPIGACLAGPQAALFAPGQHGSTFGGGPVQCAAALAVLGVIEREGLLERAVQGGERLQKGLDQIFGGEAEVRGIGMLVGVQLPSPVARDVTQAALERGVLINDAAADVLRLAPPLVISDEEIDRALSVIEEVWDEIAAA